MFKKTHRENSSSFFHWFYCMISTTVCVCVLWGQETIVKYKGMINSALGHKNCWSKTFPHGKPRFQSSQYGQIQQKCFSTQYGKILGLTNCQVILSVLKYFI